MGTDLMDELKRFTHDYEYYRDETLRLRSDIDGVIDYCKRKAAEFQTDNPHPTGSFDRGLSAAYRDVMVRLIEARY